MAPLFTAINWKAVAIHECGHVVVAYHLGIVPISVEYTPHYVRRFGAVNLPKRPEVRSRGPMSTLQRRANIRLAEHEIMTFLGGPSAERVFFEKYPKEPRNPDGGSRVDDENISHFMRHLERLVGKEAARAWRKRLDVRVERIVRKRWHQIERLAPALRLCGSLDRRAIIDIARWRIRKPKAG